MNSAILYARVSTKRQLTSLTNQVCQLVNYAKSLGITDTIIYQNVSSGLNTQDAVLLEVLNHSHRESIPIISTYPDRLTRSLEMYDEIVQRGTKLLFINESDVVRDSIARSELTAISIRKRTKAALQTIKDSGVVLGSPVPMSEDIRSLGREVISNRFKEFYLELVPIILDLKSQGLSLRAIASILNESGYKTQTGKPLSPVSVSRILEKL